MFFAEELSPGASLRGWSSRTKFSASGSSSTATIEWRAGHGLRYFFSAYRPALHDARQQSGKP